MKFNTILQIIHMHCVSYLLVCVVILISLVSTVDIQRLIQDLVLNYYPLCFIDQGWSMNFVFNL